MGVILWLLTSGNEDLKGSKKTNCPVDDIEDNKQDFSSISICSTYYSYCEGMAVCTVMSTTEVL